MRFEAAKSDSSTRAALRSESSRLRQALEAARARGLDLVEVSPDATPPVTKILDYGKFKYAPDA